MLLGGLKDDGFLEREIMAYKIVAFTKDWKFKGYVDPSLRDDVAWICIADAISYILINKPKDEYWLIMVFKE